MQKDFKEDKALIALVVIFLVGVIGFNLEQFTGGFTLQENKDVPIVTVIPKEVKAGYMVDVNVQVRDACVDPTVEFFFGGVRSDGSIESSGGRKAEVTKKGRYKFCKNDYELAEDNSFTVSYRTKPNWDGDYYARVYYYKDRNTKDYLHSYFKVKPKAS